VVPNAGKYFAITGRSGGYSIPIEAPGDYVLSFSGPVDGQLNVTVGTVSVLADLVMPVGSIQQAGSAREDKNFLLIPPAPPVMLMP
jgi:hypothetical protein